MSFHLEVLFLNCFIPLKYQLLWNVESNQIWDLTSKLGASEREPSAATS